MLRAVIGWLNIQQRAMLLCCYWLAKYTATGSMLRAVIGWLNIQQRAVCCVLLLAG